MSFRNLSALYPFFPGHLSESGSSKNSSLNSIDCLFGPAAVCVLRIGSVLSERLVCHNRTIPCSPKDSLMEISGSVIELHIWDLRSTGKST